MPDRDLQSLKADFLSEDIRLSYQVWSESPWKDKPPKEVFFNNAPPYASINERATPGGPTFASSSCR
jgi:hypothetical protein